jgi:hypothetical protein
MLVELNKHQLKTLCRGTSPSQDTCIELEKRGFMKSWGGGFSSYGWDWVEEFLDALTEEELFKLYNEHKSGV